MEGTAALLSNRAIGETIVGILLALAAYWAWRWHRYALARVQDVTAASTAVQARALTEEKDRAHEANQLKSEFLATISREIRTPMTGVLGTLDLALATTLTREQRDYLALAKDSAESLLSLLDDILDFSLLEVDQLAVEEAEFSVRQCISGAVTTMKTRAAQMRLKTEVAPEVPGRVVGDPERIRQIILKLLETCVKYAGGAIVILSVNHELHDGRSFLDCTLRSAKLRVPEEQQKSLDADVPQGPGLGLGLAICGRLARVLGGRCWIERDPRRGDSFHFRTPVGLATRPIIAEAIPKPAWENIRVLVVEDNRVNQVVVSRLLEKRSIRAVLANNGREALSVLEEIAVDLVLMDVQMPEMDGIEATRRIRDAERSTGAHLPIVALTANAMAGDREKYLRAGMDGYLAKPIQSEELYDAIADALPHKRGPSPQPQ